MSIQASPVSGGDPMSHSRKTRVLFVEGNTDGTVGGSYFVLYDLVKGLDRQRFEAIVVFHRENYLIDWFKAAGVETVVVPPPSPLNFASSWLNRLLAPVKRLVNVHRGLIAPAQRYAEFMREQRIDLVNLNNSITRNHPWMLASMLAGMPCITHEMGLNDSFSLRSRFFGRRMRRIICVSHAVHEAMKKCGLDFPTIEVIHCGIDLSRYERKESPEDLRRKHDLPADATVIGVIGNIRRWKGQETLVRATALLKKDHPNLRVLLVGACGQADADYGRELQQLCRELDVEREVVFCGFQRNAIDYMALMDVVTHTSITPEPFGIVTLEAMSLRKPLVSTTIGGPAEVVINGETGLLVEPGKPPLLAAAVHRFLTDRDFAGRAGELGFQRLQSHFTMQRNIDKTTAVYEQVLRAESRPS